MGECNCGKRSNAILWKPTDWGKLQRTVLSLSDYTVIQVRSQFLNYLLEKLVGISNMFYNQKVSSYNPWQRNIFIYSAHLKLHNKSVQFEMIMHELQLPNILKKSCNGNTIYKYWNNHGISSFLHFSSVCPSICNLSHFGQCHLYLLPWECKFINLWIH